MAARTYRQPMVFRARHHTYVSTLLITRIAQLSTLTLLFVSLAWGIGREL